MKKIIGIIFLFWTYHLSGQQLDLARGLDANDTIMVYSTQTSCNGLDRLSKIKIYQDSDSSYCVKKYIPYATEIAFFKYNNYDSHRREAKRFLKENDFELSTYKTIKPTPLDSLMKIPYGLLLAHKDTYLLEKPEANKTLNWKDIEEFCQNVIDSTLTINDSIFIAGAYTVFDIELKKHDSDSTQYLIKERKFKGWIEL